MSLGSRTILIADDDPQSRLLVSATLARESFTITEARDGREAWQFLNEFKPALAILDINMPGLTGLELTRMIDEDPKLETKVILLTASSDDARAGMEAGARLYLTKPFSPLELRRLVHKIWVTA